MELKRIGKKFHQLVSDSNIELTIESEKHLLSIAKSISNKKHLRIEPIDLNFKDKCIAYCPELSIGIMSRSNYLNIETMNIISSYDNNKEYYVSLAIKLLNQNTF